MFANEKRIHELEAVNHQNRKQCAQPSALNQFEMAFTSKVPIAYISAKMINEFALWRYQ